MTLQSQVIGDVNYRPVHDHGFVGLIDKMGSDNAIVQCARVSYGTGTKSVREDRGLIRYLLRHKHTSPFEQCQIKVHVKTPIFVMRQWVRHRTASLNEYSGRYSVMTDEFYMPSLDYIMAQSTTNKQGRDGGIDDKMKLEVQRIMQKVYADNYKAYRALLNNPEDDNSDIVDVYSEDSLFEQFPGISREIARLVLPVANYTEFYWSQNLLNMMHLLKLRMDSHAQQEIQDYAKALYSIVEPIFPLAFEAFQDYVVQASNMSRMDLVLISDLLSTNAPAQSVLPLWIAAAGSKKALAANYGMSERELTDFANTFKITI